MESWGKPNAQGRHGLTADTPAHTVYSHCVQHARSHRLQSLCTTRPHTPFTVTVYNTPAHTVYSHCVQHARTHRLQSLCTEALSSEFNRDVLTTVLNNLSSPTLIIDFDYVLVCAHLEKQTYRVRPSPTLIIGFDYVLASVTFGETDIQSMSLHVSVSRSHQ